MNPQKGSFHPYIYINKKLSLLLTNNPKTNKHETALKETCHEKTRESEDKKAMGVPTHITIDGHSK